MARTYTDANGFTLIIPDSSVVVNVNSQPTGIGTTGVIALVGEADQGPHWTEESSLSDAAFGPGDLARVINKYGSGRLVEAFKGLIGPSLSPKIQGSFSKAFLIKTNKGVKASKTTDDGHGIFRAKIAGYAGNYIKESIITEVAESAPTTGYFSYVPSAVASTLNVRVNGGALQTLTIPANTTPSALANQIIQANNLNAVGGINRNITSGLSASNSVELSVLPGQMVEIKLAAPAVWGNNPQVGDTLSIPTGSVIAGPSNENVGWYLVTAVSNTASSAKLTAKKITAGAPVAVSSVAFSATPSNDIVGYSYMRIDNMSGRNRQVLNGLSSVNASISASGNSITFTLSGSNVFASNPKVGDLVYIRTGTPFAGASSENVGWYSVTAVSNFPSSAFITAIRLSNGLPVTVSSTAISASEDDIIVYDKQIRGAGKSLELIDSANCSNIFKQLGVDAAVDWLDKLLYSAAELKKKFTLVRQSPLSSENFVHGGNVVINIGYQGTTAQASIVDVAGVKRLQTTVTGGVGSNLDIALKDYNTIADLVDFLNLQPGYSASAQNGQEAGRSPELVLDYVSNIGICTSLSNKKPGRIKRDVFDITKGIGNLSQTSILVEYEPLIKAGLPEDEGPYQLTGGVKGATTGLDVVQAIDALAGVRANFIVPLFSQDASLDKLTNETEAGSTYTIDAINAAVNTHCISQSTAKTKRHRVCLLSKWGSFEDVKQAAQDLSSFRAMLFFQKVKGVGVSGNIETFQPWMLAVKAASMQAAGFYRAIFNKEINISGIIDPVGFNNETVSLAEDALLAGLCPAQKQENGSYLFLSDQTTYGRDSNFVYNSLQAVYNSDIIALTLAASLKNAFVGESVSDVSPQVVVSFIKAKMAELMNKKLIVGTEEFPSGYKSITVSINEGVLSVNAVIILATAIYFIPITLDIEGLSSSASA